MKKRSSLLSLLIVIAIGLYSCKNDDSNEVSYTEQLAIGRSVFLPDTISLSESVIWKIKVGTPVLCHQFSRSEIITEENRTTVSLYTKYKEDDICVYTTGAIDTSVSIIPVIAGWNYFILNPNTNFETTDTIFVKN